MDYLQMYSPDGVSLLTMALIDGWEKIDCP